MGGINFGLAQLSRLERGGAVNLHGTKLAVAGVANSVTAYRSIKGALYRDVPSGIVLIKDTVQPPTVFPFEWRASFKNNQLVLEGYVPSEQERDSLAAVAKEVFKNSPIVDKMAVAAGAPVGWLSVATMTLRHAARLQEATAVLSNTKLTISGQAQKQKNGRGCPHGPAGVVDQKIFADAQDPVPRTNDPDHSAVCHNNH